MATQTVNECAVDIGPLDLHDAYQEQSACGYEHDLRLHKHQVQEMAERLRGIASISAILIAEGGGYDVKLGDWLRGGLIGAIHSLTQDMQKDLERANDRIQQSGLKSI